MFPCWPLFIDWSIYLLDSIGQRVFQTLSNNSVPLWTHTHTDITIIVISMLLAALSKDKERLSVSLQRETLSLSLSLCWSQCNLRPVYLYVATNTHAHYDTEKERERQYYKDYHVNLDMTPTWPGLSLLFLLLFFRFHCFRAARIRSMKRLVIVGIYCLTFCCCLFWFKLHNRRTH